MLKFKEKLQKFYGKSFTKVSKEGGFFDIAHGEFLETPLFKLVFYRTDEGRKKTKKGIENIERNKKLFFENLEILGIIFINKDSGADTWRKITCYFTNDTAPKCMRRRIAEKIEDSQIAEQVKQYGVELNGDETRGELESLLLWCLAWDYIEQESTDEE